MSAFENFIQAELPKRGYLTNDVPAETIIIRRGAGTREFSSITLNEGEVLTLLNGVLVSAPVAHNLRSFTQAFSAASTWSATHGLNSENIIIQAFDQNKFVLIPNTIQILNGNSVQVTFSALQTGTLRILFLD